mgnify:CR=1 FL=1
MPIIPLSTQFFQGRSKETTGQNIINMYVEENPANSKSPYAIYDCAGLTLWLDLEFTAPIHGMYEMLGILYVVCGQNVYQITSDKTKIFLGAIDNQGRVSISGNGTQVIICTENSGYIIENNILTQITDSEFLPLSTVDYFINFFVGNINDNTGAFAWSQALDGTAWNGEFATTEKNADKLIGLINFNDAIWLFGQKTIELYTASNDVTSPFQYYQGSVQSTCGCGAKNSIFSVANQLFWLGNDRIIYTNNGNVPLRISNHAIEKEIMDMSIINDAIAYSYTQDGHKFYVITFPTAKKTYSYDILTKMWSKRSSFGLGRWRANAICNFNELQLVGDYINGKIYYIDSLNYTENDEILERTIYTAPVYSENARLTLNSIWLDVDCGFAKTTGQGDNPQIMMQLSNDGGYTWGNENWRSAGKIGEYIKQVVWRRCGMARNRLIRFTMTDPVPFRISSCYAEISVFSK